MSLDYCDQFLYLDTITEPTLDSISSNTAVITSPLDFSSAIESFLHSDDGSASTEEVPKPTSWNSPRLLQTGTSVKAQSYIAEVLDYADQQNVRRKRVRFDDLGASPRKRAKMATRLEELVYQDAQQDNIWSDSDLLKLQMLALHGLQKEKSQLIARVKLLEDENRKLVEVNLQQSDRQSTVLNEISKRRGLGLIRHGEFLVALAEPKAEISGRDHDGSVAL